MIVRKYVMVIFDTSRMIMLGQAGQGVIPVEQLGPLDNVDLNYIQSVKDKAAEVKAQGIENPVFGMPYF